MTAAFNVERLRRLLDVTVDSVSELGGRVSQHDADLGDLDSDAAVQGDRIKVLEAEVKRLGERLSTLERTEPARMDEETMRAALAELDARHPDPGGVRGDP